MKPRSKKLSYIIVFLITIVLIIAGCQEEPINKKQSGRVGLALTARQFTSGRVITPKPIYESIVNCMQVEELIFVAEAQRLNFANALRGVRGNIERVPMYVEMLKQFYKD